VEVIAMAAAIWVWTVEVVPVRDGAATLPDLKGYDVVARDGEVSQANIGKDQIKRAPDYDAKRRNEADVRKSHEDHYGTVGQGSRRA
jgi:hypothetical protein